jgi:ABC-type transport system involved in multi-copper enzyme maturation permease subunit
VTGSGLRAEIHDLGYKRYTGPRDPASGRWRVIMRYQLAFAWQNWWRYKLAVVLSVITTFVFGTLIYVLRSKTMTELDKTGLSIAFVDLMMITSVSVYVKIAFILSLTLTVMTIANDARSGALTFHFVRSTRPIDYVIGRFAGLCILNAALFVGPVLLALLRAGLSGATGGEGLDKLALVGELAGLAVLAIGAYSSVPLAFSALSKQPWTGFGMWAGWYVMGTGVAALIGAFVWGPIGALDLAGAVDQAAYKLVDLPAIVPGGKGNSNIPTVFIPLWAALLSLALQTAVALAFTVFKLQRAQRDAAGGS